MSRKIVNEPTLRQNISWNLDLIAVQVRHAELAQTRGRSGYYKLAIITSASIIEALVHLLLRRHLGADGIVKTGDKECFECQALPATFNPPGSTLAICRQREVTISIDSNPDFGKMNKICFQYKIFTKSIFDNVENVRKIRNKIHLQGLDHIDRSYTKKDLGKVSKTMEHLLSEVYGQ